MGALALGACGEDDDDKVRSVAELFASTDPAVCDSMTRAASEGFVGSIQRCRRAFAAINPPRDASIERVKIKGERATVIVARGTNEAVIELAKREEDWKIVRLGQTDRPVEGQEEQEDEEQKPLIRRGLNPRATAEAYIQAIRDGDEAAFCGLLSKRHVDRLLHAEEAGTETPDCVTAKFNWKKARETSANVKTVRVIRSGNTATVTFSSGNQAQLKKDNGRWVIDAIKR